MEADSAGGTVELAYLAPTARRAIRERSTSPCASASRDRSSSARWRGGRTGRRRSASPTTATTTSAAAGRCRTTCSGSTRPEYTLTDAEQIPTGEIRPVEGTRLDFTPSARSATRPSTTTWCCAPTATRRKPAARVFCPRTGSRLALVTGEPGIQAFDAPTMTIDTPGHDGRSYGRFAGLCLEAQHFPDSLHRPDWPSIIRDAGQALRAAAGRGDRADEVAAVLRARERGAEPRSGPLVPELLEPAQDKELGPVEAGRRAPVAAAQPGDLPGKTGRPPSAPATAGWT